MPRNGVAYLAHVALLNDCVRKPSILPVLTGERASRTGYSRLTLRTSRRNLRGRMPDITTDAVCECFCRYIASENL